MKSHEVRPLVSMGDGYSYQIINLGHLSSSKGYKLQLGYVKIWLDGRVVDRALTVKAARRRAKLHRARLDAMLPEGFVRYGDLK